MRTVNVSRQELLCGLTGVVFMETPICVNDQGAPMNRFTIPISTYGF